ncbi:MAG: hypothetical protein NT062_31110 [Proteobacteria bacterium]|nr:hypothetical protein [Pseudomonadota bacterium]
MRSYWILPVAVLAAACGNEIGDSCVTSSDCSPNGDRQCDTSSHDGYCTIQGCDYSTCPEEAACVRFFTGNFANRTCDPLTEDATGGTDACSFDELCALAGHCVPRSSEVRYCMRTCSTDDDCRGGYECRTLDKMKAHGGQPVLAPGKELDESVPKFCAARPAAT